jgi:hypothetical protein
MSRSERVAVLTLAVGMFALDALLVFGPSLGFLAPH